jgi:hypothetical protein
MYDKRVAPIIFIGPCMSHDEVEKVLDIEADIRAPIRRGDLDSIPESTQVIGIVDGVFFSNLSVSPREILSILKKGIHVVGSSSMGALRVAELDVYGMKGIGAIYDMYKRGIIESDAEVALTFHPKDYRTLSEPLVNIRYFAAKAHETGLISLDEVNKIIESAQKIYFFELNYDNLFKYLEDKIERAKIELLRAFVNNNKNELDLKRQDAIKLLKYINDLYKS